MKLSKLEAAEHLLDRSVEAYLDRGDAISAIVLGGAAEDIYIGLLKRDGQGIPSSRAEMAEHVIATASHLFPGMKPLATGEAHAAIRSAFNWLRHNDPSKDDPQDRTIDEVIEAISIIERAMENRLRLTGRDHPRRQELVLRDREIHKPN